MQLLSCFHFIFAAVCGVLYNYNELSLNLSGYTKCYDQPYSHITTSAELAACKGSTWVFVGAKNSSTSTTIVLGAFGYSSAVYTTTSSTTIAYLDKYGGVYWYNYPLYGFGFSGVPSVNILIVMLTGSWILCIQIMLEPGLWTTRLQRWMSGKP